MCAYNLFRHRDECHLACAVPENWAVPGFIAGRNWAFDRKFTEATGKTPAHFVEGLRLDAARTLLAQGLPIKTIAGKVGLSSPARLGQAFERRFGMAPSLFREMHRAV